MRAAGVDDRVELVAGDLEVVAHGLVGGVEQPAERGVVAGAQHLGGLVDPGHLGEHVAGATPYPLVGDPLERAVPVLDLTQRGDAERSRGSSQSARREA